MPIVQKLTRFPCSPRAQARPTMSGRSAETIVGGHAKVRGADVIGMRRPSTTSTRVPARRRGSSARTRPDAGRFVLRVARNGAHRAGRTPHARGVGRRSHPAYRGEARLTQQTREPPGRLSGWSTEPGGGPSRLVRGRTRRFDVVGLEQWIPCTPGAGVKGDFGSEVNRDGTASVGSDGAAPAPTRIVMHRMKRSSTRVRRVRPRGPRRPARHLHRGHRITYLARTGSQVTIEAGRRSSDLRGGPTRLVHVRDPRCPRERPPRRRPSPVSAGSGTVGPSTTSRSTWSTSSMRITEVGSFPGTRRRATRSGPGDHATEIGSDAGASGHPSASPASELWV